MSKTVLALFAACVGLSLLSLHLVKQMRAGQETITQLQTQVAKLESERQNQAPEPSPAPAATWQVEPVTPPPAAPAKEAVAAISMKRPRMAASDEVTNATLPSREERMRMMREARERQRQLMQDPDYREAVRVQQRSAMTRQYPGVARELGLTQDQAEQLFDLLSEQQMRNNEQAELLWDPEGLDPAALQQRQEKMQQRWMEMQQKNDAELTAQLGPEKVQAWKEYQSTLGAHHQAEQLRSTLASRGVSLNEEASHAVVKAYAEAQKAEMQDYANMARANVISSSGKTGLTARIYAAEPSAEMFQRQMELTQKRNQRVLEALSPFLTYEQREALQKEQEAEVKMQEAQMRIMRAQSTADPTNNGGFVGNSVQTIIVPDE